MKADEVAGCMFFAGVVVLFVTMLVLIAVESPRRAAVDFAEDVCAANGAEYINGKCYAEVKPAQLPEKVVQ